MQIHELQLHRLAEGQLAEVDLVGPGSVFNVGREVLKNPKAFVSSRALGAAQQAATQRYAAKLAPKVTQQANANIAPLARQLAAGWPQIAKTLQAPVMSQGSATPNTQQPAAGKTATAQPTVPNTASIRGAKPGQRTAADYERLEQMLQAQLAQRQTVKEDAAGDYRDSFIQYAQRVLGARGIDTKVLRNDEKINAQLDFLLKEIVRLANQPQLQTAKVEEYFTTALTAYNQMVADPAMYQRLNPQNTNTGTNRQTAVQAGDADQQLQNILDQIGISKAQLGKLAQVATNANRGNSAFRPTGNPTIDAVLQTAGMRPTS